MTNPEPAHKFTRANDFNVLTALSCNSVTAKAAPPSCTGLAPQGAKRSFASRRMVQLAASFAAPEASFEAASRRLRTRWLRVAYLFPPATSAGSIEWTNPSARFVSGSTRPKNPRKRNARFAERNESFRITALKSLKSLMAPNQAFRGIVCFQGFNRLFVSRSRGMRSPDPNRPKSSAICHRIRYFYKREAISSFSDDTDQIRPVRQGLKSAVGQAPRRESERSARICPDVVDSGRRWNGQDGQLRFPLNGGPRRQKSLNWKLTRIDQYATSRWKPRASEDYPS
jgi:hypothetical protein